MTDYTHEEWQAVNDELGALLDQHDAGFAWDGMSDPPTWCLYGPKVGSGPAWETDDYPARDMMDAKRAAVEYLKAYHDTTPDAPPDDVRDIAVTLFRGNLLNDEDGVNMDASAVELARLVEETLQAEYPGAAVDVTVQNATGAAPRPTINGDPYHAEHWRVDELVQNCWGRWNNGLSRMTADSGNCDSHTR